MLKILKYIILGSFIGCFCADLFSEDEKGELEDEIGFYQGFKVELDAYSLVMSAINKDTYSFEANVQVNLKERFFPILEMGFAGANKTSINGYGFKTNGLFTKIGVDYNLLKPNLRGTTMHKYFFVGGRYGFSRFSYDITNIAIDNGYWGGENIRNFENQKLTKHWLEVVAGLRVEILENVYIGWNVRLKMPLGKGDSGEISPWFVPGIGIVNAGNWAFNYTVGYKF